MPCMEGSWGLYPGSLLECHQSSSVLLCLDELCHFTNDFQLERSGSYGDVLPSCCMPVPCGTKECLFRFPNFCLGVDIGFLGFEDCAGVCCSPMMGLTQFKLYPISVMLSKFLILEKEVLFMWAFSSMNSRWIIVASCSAWSDSLHACDMM